MVREEKTWWKRWRERRKNPLKKMEREDEKHWKRWREKNTGKKDREKHAEKGGREKTSIEAEKAHWNIAFLRKKKAYCWKRKRRGMGRNQQKEHEEAEDHMKKMKIPRWIETHRRLKWRMAMRIASLPQERWTSKIIERNPGLDNNIGTNRPVGRSRKRWDDDIDEQLRPEETEEAKGHDLKNNSTWKIHAKNKRNGEQRKKKFAKSNSSKSGRWAKQKLKSFLLKPFPSRLDRMMGQVLSFTAPMSFFSWARQVDAGDRAGWSNPPAPTPCMDGCWNEQKENGGSTSESRRSTSNMARMTLAADAKMPPSSLRTSKLTARMENEKLNDFLGRPQRRKNGRPAWTSFASRGRSTWSSSHYSITIARVKKDIIKIETKGTSPEKQELNKNIICIVEEIFTIEKHHYNILDEHAKKDLIENMINDAPERKTSPRTWSKTPSRI